MSARRLSGAPRARRIRSIQCIGVPRDRHGVRAAAPGGAGAGDSCSTEIGSVAVRVASARADGRSPPDHARRWRLRLVARAPHDRRAARAPRQRDPHRSTRGDACVVGRHRSGQRWKAIALDEVGFTRALEDGLPHRYPSRRNRASLPPRSKQQQLDAGCFQAEQYRQFRSWDDPLRVREPEQIAPRAVSGRSHRSSEVEPADRAVGRIGGLWVSPLLAQMSVAGTGFVHASDAGADPER